MTNYERIKNLPKEELAWVLMNDVTSGSPHGCPLCIYKDWELCKEMDYGVRVSCIEGHRRWLNREPTEEDETIYKIAKNNAVISEHDAMDKEESLKWKVVVEDGYAVRLSEVIEGERIFE